MKILVFNGSPKSERSNTLKLTNSFLEGISEATETEIEIIDINKLNLKECRGCFCCWNKTPGKCIINDDMEGIIQKQLEADVIIWSFPLYYFSLPSRLKTVIDRQLPMNLPFMDSSEISGGHKARYDLSGKRYVAISTCGFYTAQGNYTAVNEQFNRMYGKDGYTAIFCGQGELFRVTELKKSTDSYLETVRIAGREFAKGDISPETSNQLSELILPRKIYERMADASWGIEKDNSKTSETKSVDTSLVFTKQMASLYNENTWNGHDVILEFLYTDVNKRYQIILGKDGHKILTENFLPYTTKIETPLSVWREIGSGKLDGRQAMMDKLYRVTGDFDIMLKWDEYFSAASQPKKLTDTKTASKKTNMTLMLLPWVAIWTAVAIDSFWGGIIGIMLCAALPLAFLKYLPTVFEYITIPAVTIVSLLSLLGFPTAVLLPLSYLAFGIMWTVTVFLKLPLSAYYSMNNYGGQAALSNPLFVRTNKILTACWGVLYLLTPIWTFFLMQTPLSALTGLFNSVLPIGMGIFTIWFQKWYPKHYAAGSIK